MVVVHLYGSLRRYAPPPSFPPIGGDERGGESVVRLEPQSGETVGTLLARLNIPPAEVYHVFLNGALLSTRNSMAPWLGYQQVREGAPGRDSGLDVPVQDEDRLGLFASDMALLVV